MTNGYLHARSFGLLISDFLYMYFVPISCLAWNMPVNQYNIDWFWGVNILQVSVSDADQGHHTSTCTECGHVGILTGVTYVRWECDMCVATSAVVWWQGMTSTREIDLFISRSLTYHFNSFIKTIGRKSLLSICKENQNKLKKTWTSNPLTGQWIFFTLYCV